MLIFLGSLILNGCSKEEDDFGRFYEYPYKDTATVVLSMDTVNTVLVNVRNLHKVEPNVLIDTLNNPQLLDTIRLMFDIYYEGYNPTPSPQIYYNLNQDTLFYYYGHSPIIPYTSSDTHIVTSGLQIQTSPKPTYYSIYKVIICKSPDKYITLQFRNFTSP